MKALSLFSGIGGLDLAAEWAGFKTVAFCEYAEFPRQVLNKHWPDVPIFKDIKLLNKELLESEGIDTGTIKLIHGGFPCQPYSSVGKRQGKEDDRDLWPEMFRVIKDLRADWIVGENVANFANMELDRTLSDLESIGYEARSFVLPASAVGASHQRSRTFIVAHAVGKRCSSLDIYQEERCRSFSENDYPIKSVSIPFERIYEVKDWLRGSGKLITHNDPDKYRECIASFNQKNQFENEWGVFYTFDLLFRSQPFRRKVRETAIDINKGTNRYFDHGQETSQPYLEINSLGGTIDIQLNDMALTLLNTQKGFLFVDTERKLAVQNGVLLFTKGNWLKGKPGNNSLFINQSIGTGKLYPRSVWL